MKIKTFVFFTLLIICLSLAPVRAEADWEKFYSRPQVEQRAIQDAARAVGMPLGEFLEIIEPLETKKPLDITQVLLIVVGAISIVSLLTAIVLWVKQQRVEKVLGRSKEQRDKLRKSHLKQLSKVAKEYYAQQGHYPSEEEFELIREKKHPLILDPNEGQERAEGGRFSYYYTRKPRGSSEIDPYYYRLWCFLEESDDKEAHEGKYILSSDLGEVEKG